MMDQEKYKKQLLDKFLSKNFTREERHELEKLALDDPFLFEAMQGFTEVDEDHAADLKIIRNKKREVKTGKRRSLVPYGIAASLLVLVSVSVWTLSPNAIMVSDQTFAEAKQKKSTSRDMLSMTKDRVGSTAEVEEPKRMKHVESSETELPQVKAPAEPKALLQVENEIIDVALVDQNEEVAPARGKKMKKTVAEVSGFSDDTISEDADMAAAPAQATSGEANSSVMEVVSKSQVIIAEDEPMKRERAAVEEESFQSAMPTTRKKEKVEHAKNFDGVIAESESSFENYFNTALGNEFSKLALGRLKKNVSIEFDVQDEEIVNFVSTPAQTDAINDRLKAILQEGLQYLPERLINHTIDLRTL